MKWIGNAFGAAIGWTFGNLVAAVLVIFVTLTLCGCLCVLVTIITSPGTGGG